MIQGESFAQERVTGLTLYFRVTSLIICDLERKFQRRESIEGLELLVIYVFS